MSTPITEVMNIILSIHLSIISHCTYSGKHMNFRHYLFSVGASWVYRIGLCVKGMAGRISNERNMSTSRVKGHRPFL